MRNGQEETFDVSFYGRVSLILWGLILAPSYHSCLGNGIVLNFYYFETLKLKMLQTPTIWTFVYCSCISAPLLNAGPDSRIKHNRPLEDRKRDQCIRFPFSPPTHTHTQTFFLSLFLLFLSLTRWWLRAIAREREKLLTIAVPSWGIAQIKWRPRHETDAFVLGLSRQDSFFLLYNLSLASVVLMHCSTEYA